MRLAAVVLAVLIAWPCYAAQQPAIWTVTAYCACKKCCGPNARGLTASGKPVREGMVACNVLPFGTRVRIAGRVYTVEDRGARRLFEGKKRIDVYFRDHAAAAAHGVKYYKEVKR